MDLYCQICAEPFEAYHVHHDMETEEKKEFLGGQGCIACNGVVPEGGRSVTAMASAALIDILGDDLDGVAAMMQDFEMGY